MGRLRNRLRKTKAHVSSRRRAAGKRASERRSPLGSPMEFGSGGRDARARRQLQAAGRAAAYLGGGFLLLSAASSAAVRSLRSLSDANQVPHYNTPKPLSLSLPPPPPPPSLPWPELGCAAVARRGNSRRRVAPARGRGPTRAGSAGAARRSSGLRSTTRCSSTRASALPVTGLGWPSFAEISLTFGHAPLNCCAAVTMLLWMFVDFFLNMFSGCSAAWTALEKATLEGAMRPCVWLIVGHWDFRTVSLCSC